MFRSSLTVFAAALYVLLGISASWHAPHFMRGEATIGVDAHSEHEVALDGGSCALCSSKVSHSHASTASVRIAHPLVLGMVWSRPTRPPVDRIFIPARARAPPPLS